MTISKRVILIGGTGFLGYHAIMEFLKNGWGVTAVGLPPAPPQSLLPESVKIVLQNLEFLSDEEILNLLRGYDALVFAAGLDDRFRGPTAVVYHPHDPVATARGLMSFAKDHPALAIKGGLIEQTQTVDAAGVKTVSELPGMQELRAMLLGVLQAPAGKLVRLLNTPAVQLARVIGERERQLAG